MSNIRKIQRRIAEREQKLREASLPSGLKSQSRPPPKSGLFLDDDRNPREVIYLARYEPVNWRVVRNVTQFKEAIEQQEFDVYSFDYYLGYHSQEGGLDCLKHLETYWKTVKPPKKAPAVHFHSQHRHEGGNRFLDGARLMERYWDEHLFDWLIEREGPE